MARSANCSSNDVHRLKSRVLIHPRPSSPLRARGLRPDRGDAMALPVSDDAFDAATMGLVIFFVPDPAKGVAEMVRVVRPGGTIAAYAWDILGGGFPLERRDAGDRADASRPAKH